MVASERRKNLPFLFRCVHVINDIHPKEKEAGSLFGDTDGEGRSIRRSS